MTIPDETLDATTQADEAVLQAFLTLFVTFSFADRGQKSECRMIPSSPTALRHAPQACCPFIQTVCPIRLSAAS